MMEASANDGGEGVEHAFSIVFPPHLREAL